MADLQSRPFIYIGALIRTGSTLLSEALTQFPFSYIFHEPNFGRNVLGWNQADEAIWKARGAALDHATFIHKLAALFFRKTRTRPDYIVSLLKRRYLPVFEQYVAQIGVKETRNAGWAQYAKHFPGMKTILLGRDPRDVYLSYREQALRHGAAPELLDPRRLAGFLMEEFAHQQAMLTALDCLPVRYEELVTNPNTFASIKKFVNSPLPTIGQVGNFMTQYEVKQAEYKRHGRKMTAVSVDRWRSETDRDAFKAALVVFERMHTYTEFWGYRKETQAR